MWQLPEIARIIGDFGYNVDVIDYDQSQIRLPHKYHFLIDIFPQNYEIYADNLVNDCIKILYSTGSSPAWQNSQYAARVEALNTRRQASLYPKVSVKSFGKEIESFDAMFLIGNQVTLHTYDDLTFKKIYLINNSAYQFPNLDLSRKSPNSFLYLATYPQVLKGLDLLLEIFAENTHLSLVVCSQFQAEKDFCTIYEKELFHSPNILPIGVVDITSDLFKKIIQVCSYTVLPSCSEGMSGSVLTAMSAGQVPIVSRECGFDDDEVFHLHDCSIDCITDTLCAFAQKPLSWIQSQSIKAHEIYRAKYTPEHFSTSFRTAMQGVLEKT
jgi:hypothetical protein